MVGTRKAPFRPERVSFPRRHMVVDGRIDGESEVLALIDQRREHQVGEGEDGSALADSAGVEVCRGHFQFGDGRTGGDFNETGSDARRETVACVEVILQSHKQLIFPKLIVFGHIAKYAHFWESVLPPALPGFRIMKMTAATQMAMPIAIRKVKGSPNSSVPMRMAVKGSNTPRTAVLVGPM